MSTEAKPLQTGVAAAAIAGACAILAAGALTLLSRPPDLAARISALQTRADLVQRLTRQAASGPQTPLEGRCVQGGVGEAQTLKSDVAAAATGLDLQISQLDIRASGVDDQGVEPVAVRLELAGSYQGAMSLMDELSRRRPAVFADKLDLSSRAGRVTLVFAGRVLCVE